MPPINIPANITSWSAERKITFYASLRSMGYADADIRAAVEAVAGPQADADWAYLQEAAGFKPAAGGLGVVLAAAAAYFLFA